MELSSEDFSRDGIIPLAHAHVSVGGDNTSPQLSWSGEPEGTASFALTCYDPDAPTTVGFSHWVRFDIPRSEHALARGAGSDPGPGIDGYTDFGTSGYGGMAPPEGGVPHHYRFTLYALDVDSIGGDEHTTYALFRFLARDHILAEASVTGRFGLEG